jgi:hypothetical protein
LLIQLVVYEVRRHLLDVFAVQLRVAALEDPEQTWSHDSEPLTRN